ncbi:hypothetical protein AAE02nite_12460 [Adhaeribacter aerolatus]|uniref:Glycerophosphoryl diester phosphodiesterase n=2 Tax=Adhaeribacter aerolatus TaxID=670289 RepID=A0A512AV46_9BACT|nr:hypothetical protein AAE02nite_12460 [Adhaeribacter aerolatus]
MAGNQMNTKPMMLPKRNYFVLTFLLLVLGTVRCSTPQGKSTAKDKLELAGSKVALTWQKNEHGWQVQRAQVTQNNSWQAVGIPSGEYTMLYSPAKPDSTPVKIMYNGKEVDFPEPDFKYIRPTWLKATSSVAMNIAGEAFYFFPANGKTGANNQVTFTHETPVAAVQADWLLDEKYPSDVVVQLTLTAKKDGYFSLATPTLATLEQSALAWGILPGYFQGRELQKNFVLAYAYGQGIPDKPVVVRERTATTLSPILTSAKGISMGVIANPGVGRDPWEKDHNTHKLWQLGLSLMNRKSELTPTLYHPVLGEKGSRLQAGEKVTYGFRYTLQATDWFTVYKHAIYDIYQFTDFLALKQTKQSLTDRLLAMHRYVNDDESSLWNVEDFEGTQIGAQSYLGGVVGSDKDAMKNSDYGAMWMLATITQDPVLQKTRLPFARNFKLKQQEIAPGFFQGAAVGQYYLAKGKRFTEEWGSHVEPISLTYYTMLDLGNILLFNPQDKTLRERLRLGAERLLTWQKPAGNWEVAYDRRTQQPVYTDLTDLRPTFYGLIVAYRILGDKKYLDAAVRGADWYIKNAVEKGHFTGVCGDVRFVNDFATGQSAQALLDLYDITKEERFKAGAIEAARIYTASIYTHPIPTAQTKLVKGEERKDWQISQVGLSFEHGGAIGSATGHGPIPLASHGGLFLRISQLTGEPLYRDMARAAALGRDAFVNPQTSVASYYWRTMDAGSGPFPHHAWWQIGWITDYLLAEANLRSNNQITFPRGFITPKVGPHQTYGFAPGTVFNQPANLVLHNGLVNAGNPNVDYISAQATDKNRLYIAFLNNQANSVSIQPQLDGSRVIQNKKVNFKSASVIAPSGEAKTLATPQNISLQIPGFGLSVVTLDFETVN